MCLGAEGLGGEEEEENREGDRAALKEGSPGTTVRDFFEGCGCFSIAKEREIF